MAYAFPLEIMKHAGHDKLECMVVLFLGAIINTKTTQPEDKRLQKSITNR
jgi:hypothetical protein